MEDEIFKFAKHGNLTKWFQSQVELLPKKTALVDKNSSFSFEELDQQTTLLAKYLIVRFKVKKNSSVIPLLLEPSAQYVIAYIAVIKSGAAYLHLYDSTPTDIISEMCSGVKPTCFLTSKRSCIRLEEIDAPSFVMDENWITEIQNSGLDLNVELPVTELNDVSFIAYTSGTTGKPKSIVVPQIAPMFSYYYAHNVLPFEDNEAYASYVFAPWEIMRPLLKGITTYMIDEGTMSDTCLLGQYVKRNSITRMMIAPSMLETIVLDSKLNPEDYRSMKFFMICGEVTTVKLAIKLVEVFPWIKMYNWYSAAETFDISICNLNDFVQKGDITNVYCPVGKPISGVTVHILDEQKQPMPIGQLGEVYIESIGLAKEYMNNPEKTKIAFTTNEEGKRIYKSGDVGRFSHENNLEIWGRCDSTARLRGLSVDLKALQSLLLQHPCVSSCVVTTVGELSNKNLIAYIVSGDNVSEQELKEYVASKSLSYMIPDQLIFVESIPVSFNSCKIDMKVLKLIQST